MAMQRSIDGGTQQGRIWSKEMGSKESRSQEVPSAEITRGPAGVWVLTRLAAIGALLGRVAQRSFARMRSAQARGGRKQMKLIESLPLGNRRQLLLVVCDSQRYLVGAGADSLGSILAIAAPPAARERVARERPARGPELVRRRGRDAVHVTGHEANRQSAEEPGLNLWH